MSRDARWDSHTLVRSAGIFGEKNGDRGTLQDYCDAETGGFCRDLIACTYMVLDRSCLIVDTYLVA